MYTDVIDEGTVDRLIDLTTRLKEAVSKLDNSLVYNTKFKVVASKVTQVYSIVSAINKVIESELAI